MKADMFVSWLSKLLAVALALAACQAGRNGSLPTSNQTITQEPAPSISVSTSSFSTSEAEVKPTSTPRPYRLQPGELLLAASEDDIPALEVGDQHFIGASAADREWESDELVIGLELAGESRAYPVRLLSLHEIINDEVAGVPLAVTWCPLCFSAIVFDRRVAQQTLTFAVSGYLLNSNLVMYDRQTGTLWSQLLGQGLRGAHRNEWLQVLPSRLTSWQAWRQRHPDSLILSAAALDKNPAELIDPYVGYYSSGVPGLSAQGAQDDRLAGKALVVGVIRASQAKAYPVAELRHVDLINDELAGMGLVVVYDSELETSKVYWREVAGRQLTFEPIDRINRMRDVQTGSIWRREDGVALAGPLAGQQLNTVETIITFWFAWSEFHPDSLLYGEVQEE